MTQHIWLPIGETQVRVTQDGRLTIWEDMTMTRQSVSTPKGFQPSPQSATADNTITIKAVKNGAPRHSSWTPRRKAAPPGRAEATPAESESTTTPNGGTQCPQQM